MVVSWWIVEFCAVCMRCGQNDSVPGIVMVNGLSENTRVRQSAKSGVLSLDDWFETCIGHTVA